MQKPVITLTISAICLLLISSSNFVDAQTIAIDNAENGTVGEYSYLYDWMTDSYTAANGYGTITTGTTDSSTDTWTSSSSTSPRFLSTYLHNSKQKNLTATFTPSYDAGWYRIDAHANDPNGDRATNIPYTIDHMDGQTTLSLSQVGWNGWRNLGTYQLNPGTAGSLTISTEGTTNNYVIADGARFTYLAPAGGQITQSSLTAVADSYVHGNNTTTNYGSDPLVQVKADYAGGSYHRKGYVQFDASGGVSGAIDATISLDFVDTSLGNGGGGDWSFNVYGVLEDFDTWDEGTINWDNAPANSVDYGFDADAELLGTFSISGRTGEVTFGSPELLDFILADDDGLITLAIARETEGTGSNTYIHGFTSIDGGSGAILNLTFLSIPEPTTCMLALLGLIGACLAWRRRR